MCRPPWFPGRIDPQGLAMADAQTWRKRAEFSRRCDARLSINVSHIS